MWFPHWVMPRDQGQGASFWEIQVSVRKKLSRSAGGTWTLAHLAVESPGKHRHLLFMNYSRSSTFTWPLISSQGHYHWPAGLHQRTVWDWRFSKPFRPSVINTLLHSFTAHMLPQRTDNGSIPDTNIHVKDQKSSSLHRRAAALALPKCIQFVSIVDVCI